MKSESVVHTAGELACLSSTSTWARAALPVLLAALLAACTAVPQEGGSAAPAKPQAQPVAQPAAAPVVAEPAPKANAVADAALADGLKFYQGGQYRLAETQLKTALQAGLNAPADVANANKHLAFIYCTSKRDTQCAAAFKAAKAADPAFALSKAEAGHPMWARTYKKALGLK